MSVLRELHHRMNNNLQVVASLLSLQAARAPDMRLRAELDKARLRVAALALIHARLRPDINRQPVEFGTIVTDLCAMLRQVAAEDFDRRVSFEISSVRPEIDSNQAVAIGLIVTEAVSNAIRHAYPRERRGTITIALTEDGETFVLRVADDGIGLPTPNNPATAHGLGVLLMQSVSTQLHGAISFEGRPGTRVVLRFPRAFAPPSGRSG